MIALTVGVAVVAAGLHHRSDHLDRLDHRLDAERQARRNLAALVCVMAHVDESAERETIRLYARDGRLDPRDYLADYPDCRGR